MKEEMTYRVSLTEVISIPSVVPVYFGLRSDTTE